MFKQGDLEFERADALSWWKALSMKEQMAVILKEKPNWSWGMFAGSTITLCRAYANHLSNKPKENTEKNVLLDAGNI